MLQLTTCKWVEKGIYYVLPALSFRNIATIMVLVITWWLPCKKVKVKQFQWLQMQHKNVPKLNLEVMWWLHHTVPLHSRVFLVASYVQWCWLDTTVICHSLSTVFLSRCYTGHEIGIAVTHSLRLGLAARAAVLFVSHEMQLVVSP